MGEMGLCRGEWRPCHQVADMEAVRFRRCFVFIDAGLEPDLYSKPLSDIDCFHQKFYLQKAGKKNI